MCEILLLEHYFTLSTKTPLEFLVLVLVLVHTSDAAMSENTKLL